MFVKFCQSLPFPVSMLHLHLNSAVLHHHVKTHQLPTLHHQLVALLLHHLPLVHHHDCTLFATVLSLSLVLSKEVVTLS
jgi:hypothetical protein